MGIALEVIVVLLALAVGVVAVVMLVVPVAKGIAWVIRQIFNFIVGEVGDIFRFIGAVILAIIYVPLILLNILIGRWSASAHFGRAFQGELGTCGMCFYRITLGHPIRLVGLSGLTEGLERRLPAVVKAAPTSDTPSSRTGQFEGYRIVGSLAGGGSGAKLYIAEPDAVKSAAFARMGIGNIGQVVIKTFSLQDGSSLPQIVRESRSLDAAKRMGLILDHDLTPDRFYYVMRYVPGESLSLTTKKLHATSPANGLADPQLRAALAIECDLVSTLSNYHRGGLWHKDVKPDNIIIDAGPNPRAHLVDFGLVSSLRSAMTLTTHGTEYFRDPEMVRLALKGVKVHEVDGTRFDIYAAGAVLFSMMEDSFPAHGMLSQVGKRCPEAVKWIIRRAMTDYDKRYTSADAMLADLRTVAAAADPFAVKPVDLPSMSGAVDPGFIPSPQPFAFGGAGDPVMQPQAASPGFAAAGFVGRAGWFGAGQAAAHARGAPRLRVANWWSGRTEVDPSPGNPGVPQGSGDQDIAAMAGEIAERSVRIARDAIKGAIKGVQAGAASPAAYSAAPPWEPRAGPRRPAKEQLRAARDRARAARERVRSRVSQSAGARPFRPRGLVGVAVAVALFFGVVGVVTQHAARGARVAAPAPSPSIVFNGAPAMELPHVPQVRTAKARGKAPVSQASIKIPSTMPPQEPARVEARVVVINTITRPWSETATKRVSALMSKLEGAGFTRLGETPTPSADGPEGVDLAAEARMVLDRDQVPVDAPEAPTRFAQWLADKSPSVDAVLWIAPPLDPTVSPEPRVFLFSPGSDISGADKADALRRFAATGLAK